MIGWIFGMVARPRIDSSSLRRSKLPALLLAASAAALMPTPSSAQDIKVALITSTTGAFEVYAKQSQVGLKLGFEYATQGTMQVNGRKIVIIHKDDQLKPDRARAVIEEAFHDDKADIAVGSTSSATTLAMMPVAEEAKKLLIVEVAGADSITGEKWNRYVVRTGRNVSEEAIASALVVAKKGASIATLAQDYAFGRESVAGFKRAATAAGATIVAEEFVPINTTDFTAVIERIVNALKERPGKKHLFVQWIGATPIPKIHALNPGRHGIEISTLGTTLPGLAGFKDIPNLKSALFYYYDLPKTPENDWLVKEHKRTQNNFPPDGTTMLAFNAAIAIVQAIKKAGGTDTEKLIDALAGMTFSGATGPVTIRKEDHQGLLPFYGVQFKTVSGVDWAVPELLRTFSPEEVAAPITNKR